MTLTPVLKSRQYPKALDANYWITAVVGGLFGAAGGGWAGRVLADRLLEAQRAKYAKDLEAFKQSMELEVRRLQGEIERTIIVHRAHFETEFTALQDIWRKVVKLRQVFAKRAAG